MCRTEERRRSGNRLVKSGGQQLRQRNGGSFDQGGVKAKSAQSSGSCQGLLMDTGTGEKVSFLKVSSQFSEKQYAAPLLSSFTSPCFSSPKAWDQKGVQIKPHTTHAFSSRREQNSVAFTLPVNWETNQSPTARQPPAHHCETLAEESGDEAYNAQSEHIREVSDLSKDRQVPPRRLSFPETSVRINFVRTLESSQMFIAPRWTANQETGNLKIKALWHFYLSWQYPWSPTH